MLVEGPQSLSASPSSVSRRYDADHALVALVVEVHRIRHGHAPDPMES